MIAETYRQEFKPIPAFNGMYLINKNGAVVDMNYDMCEGHFSVKTLRLSYKLLGNWYTYKQLYESVFPELTTPLKVKPNDTFMLPMVDDLDNVSMVEGE